MAHLFKEVKVYNSQKDLLISLFTGKKGREKERGEDIEEERRGREREKEKGRKGQTDRGRDGDRKTGVEMDPRI